MRHFFLYVFLLIVLFYTTPIWAICGSTQMENADCVDRDFAYLESCCPEGFRVQGVVYNDLKGQDVTDAIAAVCRHVIKGNIEIPSDFFSRSNNTEKQRVSYVCENDELMLGLACKDLPNQDALDGCTAVCKEPDGAERVIYNPDLTSNPRAFARYTVKLPNRIAGIGYKKEKLNSDQTDCANVGYKFEPVVQP